jgi:hypothetical protein
VQDGCGAIGSGATPGKNSKRWRGRFKMIRAFRREQLKRDVGVRRLRGVWKAFQMEKYGDLYQKICFKRGKQKNSKLKTEVVR